MSELHFHEIYVHELMYFIILSYRIRANLSFTTFTPDINEIFDVNL